MIVIPAIDILDGHVVRLKKGDYGEATRYESDPLQTARTFHEAGFRRIHVVDLNGAREGWFANLEHISRIRLETGLQIQTGGGIRRLADVMTLFDAGVEQVVCSSMAIQNEADWLEALHRYGGGRCILGMDLREGRMAYSGWEKTAEESPWDYLDRMQRRGLSEVLCTDISRDGMLSGVNLQLYRELKDAYPGLRFIASGGVSGPGDLRQLADAGIDAVVVGRAWYEGYLTLEDMLACHSAE